MSEWWQELTQLTRVFYCVATFFSVFFVWQLLAALIGLGGEGIDGGDMDADVGGDVDADLDHTYDDFEHGAESDASATVAAFKVLSFRSVMSFCTLFSWAMAMYLGRGDPVSRALGLATLWGLASMGAVAGLLYLLPKLAHTGTKQLASCVGSRGTVYLDIPEEAAGEVRVTVSGVLSYVKARTADGKVLKAGTPVVVKRALDQATIEVERVKD